MNVSRVLSWLLTLALLLSITGCGSGSGESSWQEQYDLGVRYLSEGNYEEAIIAFTAAIEIDPKRPEAYVGRGDAYWAQEDAASAQADYAAALERMDQAGADLYGKLAEAWVALGDREQALLVLQQGLEALGQDEALLDKAEELGFLLKEDGSLADFLADMDWHEYYRSVIALFGNSYPQPLTWPEPYYLLTDAQKEEVYRPLMRRMEMAATLDTEDPDRWLELLEGMYYILGDMDQALAIRTERYQHKLADGDNFAERTNPAGYTRTNGEAVQIYDGWGRYLEYRSGGLASNQLYEYDEKGRPIRNTSTSPNVEHVTAYEFTYAADGRLSRISFTDSQPSGTDTGSWEYFYEGNTVRRHVIFINDFGITQDDYWEAVKLNEYGYPIGEWTRI